MSEYAVVLPLSPLEVGFRVDRRAWPLHVTLVTNLSLDAARLDGLLAAVERFAAAASPFEVRIARDARFGPERDIPVDLVPPEDLMAPHRRLAGLLVERVGVEPLDPTRWFDGYRPHVTRTAAGRARQGDRYPLPDVAVVEVAPDGDPSVAVVLAAFRAGERIPRTVGGPEAASLLSALDGAGVRSWVIGGWGVDALLGERTREHHDLDLLVHVDDLPRLGPAFAAAGLTVRRVWSENRWIGVGSPSAFVADGPTGELDVHVVALVEGRPVPLSVSDVELPVGALDGRGRIAGVEVVCATAAAQLVMHSGYELPPHQLGDLEHLRELVRG